MDVNSYSAVINWFLVLLSIGVVLICWFFYLSYSYWEDRRIPYVKPHLFFGNLTFLMRKSFWDFCYELKNKHPCDYVGCRIFLSWKLALMVQTLELARRIIVKDIEYFEDRYLYAPLSDPLGSLNLFILKNPMWSTMRRELAPMFTPFRFRVITEFMNLNAKELVSKIRRDYVGQVRDANLKDLFSMYTSDTVAYSVFHMTHHMMYEDTLISGAAIGLMFVLI